MKLRPLLCCAAQFGGRSPTQEELGIRNFMIDGFLEQLIDTLHVKKFLVFVELEFSLRVHKHL
jgi:hypothetical protein